MYTRIANPLAVDSLSRQGVDTLLSRLAGLFGYQNTDHLHLSDSSIVENSPDHIYLLHNGDVEHLLKEIAKHPTSRIIVNETFLFWLDNRDSLTMIDHPRVGRVFHLLDMIVPCTGSPVLVYDKSSPIVPSLDQVHIECLTALVPDDPELFIYSSRQITRDIRKDMVNSLSMLDIPVSGNPHLPYVQLKPDPKLERAAARAYIQYNIESEVVKLPVSIDWPSLILALCSDVHPVTEKQ